MFSTRLQTKEILARYGIKPSRGLGQNLLVDQNAVKKLMRAAEVEPKDTVLEIGPGVGALTQEIARRAKRVVAVEKDANMVKILQETLSGLTNVEVIRGDALKMNFQGSRFKVQANHKPQTQNTRYKTPTTSYKVVANLPYYITAPVIRKFLELGEAKPSTITLIIQKEVAQRICAQPPDMNILAVSVQIYATPKIMGYVGRNSFWPQPNVDGAILRIIPRAQTYPLHFPKFFTIVKAGFQQPRKQLLNNFSTGLNLSRARVEQWLLANDINPTRRAETLSLKDWVRLTKELA